jgi:hypothetical protein
LKISDSQPALLTSIGRSANAAITAMMVRGQTPKSAPANFLPDDSNPYHPPRVIFCSRFTTAWRHKTTLTGITNHALLEIIAASRIWTSGSKNL